MTGVGSWRGRIWSSVSVVVCVAVLVLGSGCRPQPRWTWTPLDPPTKGTGPDGAPSAMFTDVSCVRSSAWCLAVGTFLDGNDARVLAASYDGHRWDVLPDLPLGHDPWSEPRVDCATEATCVVAVTSSRGTAVDATLAVWSNEGWTTTPVRPGTAPSSVILDDVACGGPTSCIAVGRFGTLAVDEATEGGAPSGDAPGAGADATLDTFAMAWGGGPWTALPAPIPEPRNASYSERVHLACPTPTSCARLVGVRPHPSLPAPASAQPLQMWNGTAWQHVDDPFATPDALGRLSPIDIDCLQACTIAAAAARDVPCTDIAACRFGPPRIITPVVLEWDQARWTRTALPDLTVPGSEPVIPQRVSCAKAGTCLVVAQGATSMQGWASRGGTWSRVDAPPPPTGTTEAPASVSCTPATCLAVGVRWTGDVTTAPVAYAFS